MISVFRKSRRLEFPGGGIRAIASDLTHAVFHGCYSNADFHAKRIVSASFTKFLLYNDQNQLVYASDEVFVYETPLAIRKMVALLVDTVSLKAALDQYELRVRNYPVSEFGIRCTGSFCRALQGKVVYWLDFGALSVSPSRDLHYAGYKLFFIHAIRPFIGRRHSSGISEVLSVVSSRGASLDDFVVRRERSGQDGNDV